MQISTRRESDDCCPKRTWVLLTLSDDEQMGDGDTLPQGLAFHLSRCSECRELADELSAVTGSLRTVSDHDPTDDLVRAAEAQAIAALHKGARLTGRVEVSDDWIDAAGRPRSLGLAAYARFAAAAAVIVTVGLSGYLARSTNAESDKNAPVAVVNTHDTRPDAGRTAGGHETSTAPVSKEDLAQQDVDPRVAHSNTLKATEYRIRHHRSHIEAALSDDPHGAQAAWIIPDTSKRDVGWFRVFDRPAAVLSTEPPDEKR